MSLKSVVEAELKKSGKTKSDLARDCGWSPQKITNILNGYYGPPKLDTLQHIAAALNVPVSRLMDDDAKRPDPLAGIPSEGVFFMPVIGHIPAGVPIEAITEFDGHVAFAESFVKKGRRKHCFALRVHGASMSPTILDGDVVLVDTKSEVNNGNVAAIRVDLEGSVTLKRWRRTEAGVIVLQPDNPEFEPMVFDPKSESFAIQILGRVIALHRSNL